MLFATKALAYMAVSATQPCCTGLRQPLQHACGCYRSVPDGRSAVISSSSHGVQTAFRRSQYAGITEFPLYCEGVDRTRFAYGIYLLNKVTATKATLVTA